MIPLNKSVESMYSNDAFSKWLGIQFLEQHEGYSKITMSIRKEMLNGFYIAHGGITYSLADSALAFASNSKGRKSVSIETSISHLVSLVENDQIIAEAKCDSESEKLGHYSVKVYKNDAQQTLVALFKGIVYKTSQMWD